VDGICIVSCGFCGSRVHFGEDRVGRHKRKPWHRNPHRSGTGYGVGNRFRHGCSTGNSRHRTAVLAVFGVVRFGDRGLVAVLFPRITVGASFQSGANRQSQRGYYHVVGVCHFGRDLEREGRDWRDFNHRRDDYIGVVNC